MRKFAIAFIVAVITILGTVAMTHYVADCAWVAAFPSGN
jgi:hypothetical protein